LEKPRALSVEQIRVDRVDSAQANRCNRLEPPPCLGRVRSEARRDDRIGARGEELLARHPWGERLRRRKDIAATAQAQRLGCQVLTVHREHGRVPDFEEDGEARIASVIPAQRGDLALEAAGARLRDVGASGERSDQADDAWDVGERAYLGVQYGEAE